MRVSPSPGSATSPANAVTGAKGAVSSPTAASLSPTAAPMALPALDATSITDARKVLGLSAARAIPTAALREVLAHAEMLGIDTTRFQLTELPALIQEAELQRGKAEDHRVSSGDLARAITRAKQAARITPARQNALFGFTRLIDAKFVLSPQVLTSLTARAAPHAPAQKLLLALIDQGPGGGALVWPKPQNPLELVASLVRHLLKGGGASLQLGLEPALAGLLEGALTDAKATLHEAMGGAGAFCANLASALPGVSSRFFSRDALPARIANRFAKGVEVVDAQGEVDTALGRGDKDRVARVNASAEYSCDVAFPLLGSESVLVDGRLMPLVTSGAGRIILGTRAPDLKVGLQGVDDATLARMGRDNDLFFVVGTHYLTQGAAADAAREATDLARALSVMKASNPGLVRHLQYVVPKSAENETSMLTPLIGHVESMSMNSVEVAPLLDRLADAGLSEFAVDPNVPREAAEDPAHMLEGALALSKSLKLPRVHLHGLEGDVVIARGSHAEDPERTVLALVRARQMASNKAANDSGEIKGPDDLWPTIPSVRGTGLSALHRFADAVQARLDLSSLERQQIVDRCYHLAADGTVLAFVPSRGIADRTGGTISLGDTIDAGALFSSAAQRPKKVPHGSSF